MEIKKGDKVVVTTDIPMFYRRYNSMRVFEQTFSVVDIEDGLALLGSTTTSYTAVIPTKYLVKVDAEAKEAKFKVGDKVKIVGGNPDFIGKVVEIEAVCSDGTVVVYLSNVGHSTYKKEYLELYTEPTTPTIKVGDRVRNVESGLIGVIDKIVCGNIAWVNGVDGKRYPWKSDWLELIEPTEQTEAHSDANEELQEEYMRFMKDCMSGEIYTQSDFLKDYDPSKHEVNPKPRCIPKIMFNTEFWVKYEADLAKELSVVYAQQGIDPIEAVGKAKEIIKQLKQNK